MTGTPPSRPAAPENVLLQTGDHDDCDESACMDLLGVEDPAAADVLFVTVTKSARERLDALKRHADAPPANVGVVSVQVGGSGGTARAGGEDGPAVRRISDPSDLTGVGIAISEFLSAWRDTGNRTVVCVESLTALLQYVDANRVFQFCNEITSKFERAEALAHFHITPGAHEPQVLNVLSSLFDSRVGAADLGYGSQVEESTSASEATTGPDRSGGAGAESGGDADDPFEYVAEDPDSDQEATDGDPTEPETGREPAAEPSESVDTEEADEAVEEIDLVDPRESGLDDAGVAADATDDEPASTVETSGGDDEADASEVHDTPTDSGRSVGKDVSETSTDVGASEPGPSNEPGDRPVKYALYQRTTATVVGVVVMLVLLSFLAAAMPLPIGTDGPGNGGADVPETTTPTPDAAAAADADGDQGATATATSTPEPTATPTPTAEPTPTPTATPTATETPTPSPTPTAEPTATPEPTATATPDDGSLTDGISDTLDGDEDGDDSLL
ncbi:hypothetical protein HWV07_14955 [Natronomonas salina]|uniref:DUF7504 family protein n=1 Tax=Natronomonas salina TaxID=1710540 RepID=UPI0015B71BDD|nr:hypothetical protein [Natronomonas salina]QLD90261.1 hypothetical protein HWV07_14955 [Natronomonas salina]